MVDENELDVKEAIVKNNQYNWDILENCRRERILITVESEDTNNMVISFQSTEDKDEVLPMFQQD